MIFRSIATVLKFGAVAFVLFILLFADDLWMNSSGFIGSILREINAILRDSKTQWMVFLCLGTYFVAFVFLHYKVKQASWSSQRDDLTFWLACGVFVAAVVYALNYSPSTQALTLMAGTVIGKAFGFWAGLIAQNSVGGEVTSFKSKSSQSLLTSSATILVVLLALTSIWQFETPHTFEYHGQTRWSGPWENPNLAGLLMGTGAVLALGQAIVSFKFQVLSGRKSKIMKYALGVLCIVAVGCMGRGLLHSYSRGAWFATVCGVAYLFWKYLTHLTPALSPPRRAEREN